MKKRLVMKIMGVIWGAHGCALLFLMLFAFLTVNADNNVELPSYFGLAAIAFGSTVCGMLSRRADIGVAGALIAGLFYSASLSAVSFLMGGESEYSVLVRLGIFITAALVSPLIALVPKKNAKRGYSLKQKRSAVNKYIENR